MQTITFNCRFITPAFLGGADPKGTPELRPPSIKGALRFWWRAMNGHLVAQKENSQPDYLALLAEEEKLYGGVKVNQTRSPIALRIKDSNSDYLKGEDILKLSRNAEGLSYLLYSIVLPKSLDDVGFDFGTTFQTAFSCQEKDIAILKKGIAAFWLLTFFGSLGKRARRGIGAFSIEEIKDEYGILNDFLSFKPSAGEMMIDFLKNNFSKIKTLFQSTTSPFHEYSQINLGEPAFLSNADYSNWNDAVNAIGLEMRGLRKGQTHRDPTKRTFTMDTLNKKAAFGLPLGVYEDEHVNFEKQDRRASPIYITVVYHPSEKKYRWLVSRLTGDFMPIDDKIVFESRKVRGYRGQKSWTKEDPALLDSFMQKVKSKSQPL